MNEELAEWDAVETIQHLRAGDVKRSEVLDAAIDRVMAASSLNAVAATCFDRARRAQVEGPLAGVPFFIKDLANLGGVATSWGSRGAGHYVPKRSEPATARMEATGLSCLGKSAVPEFGLTATTEPVGKPPTRNPWNEDHSCGGSSGGAGALVAASVVPMAHGSDGGGSIRAPAACCGLVGLKPTRGRLDMAGSSLLPVNIAVNGCLSRTVRDTRAFWNALDGRPLDYRSRKRPTALRIGFYSGSPVGDVHPDVQDAVRSAAQTCVELGHRVEEIPNPFGKGLNDDFWYYWGYIAWIQTFGGKALMHRGFDASKVEPWTQQLARYFLDHRWDALRAMRRLRRFSREYESYFGSFDVLVSPTMAAPPPTIGYLATDLPFETGFERLGAYCPFTFIHNVAGTPAISLPLGMSDGLPVGVQFAARRKQDALLLTLAEQLEQASPWA